MDIRAEQDMGVEMFYEKLTGLKIQEEGEEEEEEEESEKDEDGDENSNEDDETSDSEKKKGSTTISITGMTKEEKKAHKQRIKEENREKRKVKMSKYDKNK